MNTTHPNYQFQDRLGQPVEVWGFSVDGCIRQITYTTFPKWTVKEVDFRERLICDECGKPYDSEYHTGKSCVNSRED